MATTSRRNADTTKRTVEGAPAPPRRGKKADARPTPREIAAESAAIYPDTFATPPSPDEIAAEAYCIYCERGGGDGRDVDDWLEAERRISQRRTSPASGNSPRNTDES